MALYIPSSVANSPTEPFITSSMAQNRSSVSTTKSALRASNATLLDMLQDIQTELFSHRSIMLDIRSRVSHLEQRPYSSVTYTAFEAANPDEAVVDPLETPVHDERSEWLKACRNFARNSNPPLSATEFLRTPQPVSAIGPQWEKHFGSQASVVAIETPPSTPPNEKRVSAQTTEITVEVDDDLPMAKVVEIEVREPPPPPVLQPAPASRVVIHQEEVERKDFAALSQSLPVNSGASTKWKRGRLAYKARFRHTKTEKEHVILIQFHKTSDLKGMS